MPNEQVVNYLRENKEKFSKETLSEQLKQSGYPEADIVSGIAAVYDDASPTTASAAFWDFKVTRVYRTSGERTGDALFGFFAPMLFFIIPFGPFLADIFFLAYFWNRRRYIAYGVLDRWVIGIIVVGIGLMMFLSDASSFGWLF